MKTVIHAHHVSVTQSLKEYAQQKLEKLEKYFDKIQDIHIDLKVEEVHNVNEQQIAAATIHVDGASIHAEAKSKSMYASIDDLEQKLITQIKKYKQKRHNTKGNTSKFPNEKNKKILKKATERFIPKPLEVEVAAQICDDEKLNFLIFRNIENERICVVHKTESAVFEVIET